MPTLPLIDLALLAGWTSLFAGFVLKGIALTTSYRPTVLGLSSMDFLMIAIAAMLFAIALAARTWVKTQEPGAVAERRRQETADRGFFCEKDFLHAPPPIGCALAPG